MILTTASKLRSNGYFETVKQVCLSVADTKRALEHDTEFFINFFMGELLTVPVPVLHIELFDLMVHSDVKQLALAVPRGHAKTTIAKLVAVYYFIFTDFQYILYMSKTLGHSTACVNDIIGFLQCPNFVAIFGEVAFKTEQEGKGYYRFEMPWGKACIVKGFGAGQQVRGTLIDNMRPQLEIIDDLEDNDNIKTDELALELKKWYYGPFKKCKDGFPDKTLWIGNLIKSKQMLASHIQSKFWYSRLWGCLKTDGTPLWPDLWPLEALIADYEEYVEDGMADIWFAEMMNMPVNSANAIINASQISYAPAKIPRDEPDAIGFMTIDLAISNQDWGHETVIAVHLWDAEMLRWQIVETKQLHGADPVTLFPHVIAMGQKWAIGVVGIESVQYQASVKPVFEHYCLLYNVEGFKFLQVPARLQKTARIITWAGLLKKSEYVLTEGDFAITQQLLSYDPKNRSNADDVIDCCAHGVTMQSLYTQEIWEQRRLGDKDNTRSVAMQTSAYQVCKF